MDLLREYEELRLVQEAVFEMCKSSSDLKYLLQAFEQLEEQYLTSEKEKDKFKKETEQLKCQLTETWSQMTELVKKLRDAETERTQLERLIFTVKAMLKDIDLPDATRKELEILDNVQRPGASVQVRPSISILSENIDYDKSEDDLEDEMYFSRVGLIRNKPSSGFGRKRSLSVPREVGPVAPVIIKDDEPREPVAKKRSLDVQESKVMLAQPVSHLLSLPQPSDSIKKSPSRHPSMNRSFSEPRLLSPGPENNGQFIPNYLTRSTMGINGMSPALNINTPTGPLAARRHIFLSKSVLKPEKCNYCNQRIPFAHKILQCQDCGTQCHPKCRDFVTYPCIARGTPCKNKNKLADFVPQVLPMIPHVLVHCVNEIERRGLDFSGLYRIPGQETKVNELLKEFLWGKGVPNVRAVGDVSILCGCVKKFLQQLKEPLIPLTSWNDFARAAGSKDERLGGPNLKALHQAIAELPLPNKDTLAFIIMHLQRVADFKEHNKMPAENLAKVLGPTIVGYSDLHLTSAFDDTSKQEQIMMSLLSLPRDYWDSLLSTGTVMPLIIEQTTADSRYANNATVAFPYTPTSHLGSNKIGSLKKQMPNKRFFQPPWK